MNKNMIRLYMQILKKGYQVRNIKDDRNGMWLELSGPCSNYDRTYGYYECTSYIYQSLIEKVMEDYGARNGK